MLNKYAILKIAAKAFVWVCKNKKQPPLWGGCLDCFVRVSNIDLTKFLLGFLGLVVAPEIMGHHFKCLVSVGG